MLRKQFLGVLGAAAVLRCAQNKKPPRDPDIEIVRIASTRQDGRIVYEGAFRVSGPKPITGLVLELAFFESRGAMVSMQKIQLEAAALQPGEERQFDVQGKDVPRAVRFVVSATDAKGRELFVAGVSPYPLD